MVIFKNLTAVLIAISMAMPFSFAQAATTPKPAPANVTSETKLLPNLSARVVKVGKKRYVVSKRTNKQGRLLSTIVTSGDFYEIKVDEFGTGTASRWELHKGMATMRGSAPYRGHFMKMEIEQRRSKDRIFFELAYVPRIKRYKLESFHTQSYKTLGADNVIFGDTCSVSNVQNITAFKNFTSMVDSLGGSDKSSANLSCQLKIESSLLFDKSCTDTPEMRDSMDDRLKALADILQSGPIKNTNSAVQSKSGYVSSGSGTYLSCLEEHGLANHSAQIQAKLYEQIDDAQSTIDLASFEKTLSDEQYKSIKNAKAPDCAVSSDALDALKNVTTFANAGHPLFTCALPAGTSIKDPDDYRGNYISNPIYDQIVLGLPKQAMPGAMGSPGFSAESAYASTMLHELVHSSGIGDENLTLHAEACCAGVDAKGKAAACKELDSRLVTYERENRFYGVMSQAVFDSDQTTVALYVNRKLNSSNDSDDFMHRYQQYVGTKIETQSADYAAIKDNDKDGTKCSSEASPSAFCVTTQRDFAESHLIQYTKDFLDTDCAGVLTAQHRTADQAAKFCSNAKLKTILTDSVTYDTTSKPAAASITTPLMPGDSAAPASVLAAKTSVVANPYADLFTPQTGLQGIANSGATTADTAQNLTNDLSISSITMPKFAGKQTVGLDHSSSGSGSASDVSSGAIPGTAGLGSGTRVDHLSGINQSEVLASSINGTATALGNAVNSAASTVLPTANASTGVSDSATPNPEADIIVTGRRLPTKAPKTVTAHDGPNISSMLTQAFASTYAPVPASADSSSSPSQAENAYTGTAIGSNYAPASSASASSAQGTTRVKPAPIAREAIDPVTAGARSVATVDPQEPAAMSAGASGSSSAGFSGNGSGTDRGPSSAPAAKVANSPTPSGVPTFQTQQQLDQWLTLDYSRIEDKLTKTAASTQLIRLHTEVITPSQPTGVGCVSKYNCKAEHVYNYCAIQNRLLPTSRPCR